MAAAGTGKKTYWIASVRNSKDFASDDFRGVTVDDQENSYIIGQTTNALGSIDFALIKFDKLGNIVWQKSLGGNDTEFGYGITLDTSGNIYITGSTASTGVIGVSDAFLAKYNSSGTLQWQRILGGTQLDSSSRVACDSSGNVYIVGQTLSSGGSGSSDILLAKYDNSGLIQWQKSLGSASSDSGAGIGIDSSDNVYIAGTSGSFDIITAKYNSSGVIQWQKKLSGSNTTSARRIAVDPTDGNSYVIGRSEASGGAGGFDIVIARYASDGVLQWQRRLGGTLNDEGYGIAVDSTGVYITGVGRYSWSNYSLALVAKYSKTGTLSWQKVFSRVSTSMKGYDIAVKNNIVYVVGETYLRYEGGYLSAFLAKLPADGSLSDKAYGDYRYSSISLTDASSSFTDASSSLTDVSRSLTSTSINLSQSSITFENSLVNMTETYWLSTVNGSFDDYFYHVGVDTLGNSYSVGQIASPGGGFIVKHNSSGSILWQRRIHSSNTAVLPMEVKVHSPTDIYVVGYYSTTKNKGILIKYDDTGTVIWQRQLYDSSNTYDYQLKGVDTSPSGDVYVTGFIGNNNGLIAKYNSSGTLQWRRQLSGVYTDPQSIVVDSSGSCYVAGRTYATSGLDDIFLVKYSSIGVLQWQKNIQGSSQSGYNQSASRDWAYSVCLDRDENNVIIAGKTRASGAGASDDMLVSKYGVSSGSLQWTRTISLQSTYDESAFSVSTDIYDNIYLAGATILGDEQILLIKIDSEGVGIISQILFSSSGSYDERGIGCVVSASNNIYLAGYAELSNYTTSALLFKLPSTSDLTGLYFNTNVGGGAIQLSSGGAIMNSSIVLDASSRTLTDSEETLATAAAGDATSETVNISSALTIIQG